MSLDPLGCVVNPGTEEEEDRESEQLAGRLAEKGSVVEDVLEKFGAPGEGAAPESEMETEGAGDERGEGCEAEPPTKAASAAWPASWRAS